MTSENKMAAVTENQRVQIVTESKGRITHEGPHMTFSHSWMEG